MATYLICYDINKEGSAYSTANKVLTDKIKSMFSVWWHHLDSTWIVVTEMSAKDIRDKLRPILDANDELLVILSGGEGAWSGFDEKGSKWLLDNL